MPSPPTKVVMILTLGFTSEFNMTMAKISYLIHECHRPVSAFITLQEHTSTSNFKNSSTLSMRIIAENYSDIIKTRLENFDRFRIQKGISPGDLSKILLYRQEIENLGDSVRAMAMTKIDFYTTLSSHPVDFNRLTNYALDLKNNAKAFEKTTSKLIKMNKRNLQLQTEIASYELCVLERGAVSSDCMKMIREIRSEEMNSREKKLKDRDVFDRQLDLYDSDNAVLFVTCHKSKFRIADFTANAPHMLEFPHDMMNGMEINKFMPKTIADVHDKYIVNFMNGFGKHHLKEPVKTVMQTNTNYIENVQQEQNYCKSITVAHQIEFRLSGDLYIVGLLAQRSKETKAMLYTDTSGRLIGQSRAAHSKLKVNSEYFVQNKFACMLFPRLFRRYFKYGALDIPYLREDGTINHPVMLTNKFLKKQQMLESGVQEDEQEIGREEQKTDMQEETFFQSRWNSSKMQTQLMIELQTLLSEYNQRKFLMTIAELKDIELQILSVSSMIISKDKLHISEETSPRSYCILRLQTDKYSDNSSIVEIDILSAHSLPFAHSSVISLLAPLEACTFFELLTLSPSQILLAANYLYLRCCSEEVPAIEKDFIKGIANMLSFNPKGLLDPSSNGKQDKPHSLQSKQKGKNKSKQEKLNSPSKRSGSILDHLRRSVPATRAAGRKASAMISKVSSFISPKRKVSTTRFDEHSNKYQREETAQTYGNSTYKHQKSSMLEESAKRKESPLGDSSNRQIKLMGNFESQRGIKIHKVNEDQSLSEVQPISLRNIQQDELKKHFLDPKVPYSPSRASQDHGTRSMRDATSFDSPTKPKYAAVVPSHLPRSQSFDLALLPSSSNTVDPRNKNNMMKRLKECKYGLDHNILGKRIAQIGEQACIEISSSNNIDMLHKLLNLVFAMESFVMDKKKTDNITADDDSRCNYPRLYKSKAKEKTSKNTTPKRSIEVSISKQKREKSTDSRFKSPNGKPEAQNNGKQSKFSNYNSRKSIKNKDNQEIQTAYNSENRIINLNKAPTSVLHSKATSQVPLLLNNQDLVSPNELATPVSSSIRHKASIDIAEARTPRQKQAAAAQDLSKLMQGGIVQTTVYPLVNGKIEELT
jgi:hypothetical protein